MGWRDAQHLLLSWRTLGSVSSIYTAAHNSYNFSFRGCDTFFWFPWVSGTHVMHIHMCRQTHQHAQGPRFNPSTTYHPLHVYTMFVPGAPGTGVTDCWKRPCGEPDRSLVLCRAASAFNCFWRFLPSVLFAGVNGRLIAVDIYTGEKL